MADDKMRRLEAATKKVEELTRTKERLSGVVETQKARVSELEEKARADFDCEVADIPDLVEKLDAEAEAALSKAEALLAPKEEASDEDDDEDSIL